ncbi:glycoside hydrolase family 75 protein [Moelleriella libera RCEF 2490]|uniref:Endo-chitosanase n=1 Tax=Moelleriella libera RCEF 2490 TaxID=1081109 RepID=A0A162IMK5_9HYPO|nr:glycoside hydrolase family 75 protein [Moelleriella libera RCEF 2490]
MLYSAPLVAALAGTGWAYSLPDNLKSIYDAHKVPPPRLPLKTDVIRAWHVCRKKKRKLTTHHPRRQQGTCRSSLSGRFSGGAVYCADIPNALFLKGKDRYDNMDVDCDGANNSGGDCKNDPSGQGQTAFVDTVSKYGIKDLDANIHPYVVFGNEGGNPSFRPQSYGMRPLSVMAVVCNNQVHYGVWGDTNGGTSTGEASISLAKLCFPNDGLTGDNGHGPKDVLYLGFTGDEAVPGKNGANWKAGSTREFARSIKDLGDKLVAGLPK